MYIMQWGIMNNDGYTDQCRLALRVGGWVSSLQTKSVNYATQLNGGTGKNSRVSAGPQLQVSAARVSHFWVGFLLGSRRSVGY